MNTNEQQAQRDKLIELAEAWVEAETDYWQNGASGYAQSRINSAEQTFRDYVEHMHDEAKE